MYTNYGHGNHSGRKYQISTKLLDIAIVIGLAVLAAMIILPMILR